MISPDFFKSEFIRVFGWIPYVIEKCGIYFAAFLFCKFIIDIVVMVIRAIEIHKMVGRTVSFARIITAALYNIFFLSILTSIYSDDKDKTKGNFYEEMRITPNKHEEYSQLQPLYPNIHNAHNVIHVPIGPPPNSPESPADGA